MLKLEYKDYTLDFKFEAGTSRGILTKHPVMFIKILDESNPRLYGVGEVAPLHNLSIDTLEQVSDALPQLTSKLLKTKLPETQEQVFSVVKSLVSEEVPSLRMALEMALLDLLNGGEKRFFRNKFHQGDVAIPINGLIWMGTPDRMNEQIESKLAQGFKCMKMKIGAIDFQEELKLIELLRHHSEKLIIRVDANGAFPTNKVFEKLSALEPYDIHSIEQPIMAGQHEAMQLLCKRSPIPIALDEELIGIHEYSRKKELLKLIRPQYIILKPTLLGGFGSTLEWIKIANQLNIGWWLTSALESNIGLSAIAQFAADFPNQGYQGLGTGQLYENNISSPLEIVDSSLIYNPEMAWGSVF